MAQPPALLSLSDQVAAVVGWPAQLVEEGSQGGEVGRLSLQHIIRPSEHSLILIPAPPRVMCPPPTEDDSIRMVVIRWNSKKREVESRPEVHEPSAKQETGLEATLGVKHIWAVGLIYRLCEAF